MGAPARCWWLWAWGVWMGFNLLLLVLYPTFIAPLFNKFKPLDDAALKARVHGADAALRLRGQGPVRDGRQQAQRPCQRLLHRLRRRQARGVLRHAAAPSSTPAKWRRCWRTSSATSSTSTSSSASSRMFALSLAGFALLGWLSAQAWFYTGLGVQPEPGRAQRRAGAAAVPAGRAGVRLLRLAAVRAAVAQARVRGRCLRRARRPAARTSPRRCSSCYEDNASTLTPDPVFVKFYYSHPPAFERLARMAAA